MQNNDLIFFNDWATSFQTQLLFPCFTGDALAKVAMKLQNYKKFCFSETSVHTEPSVWQAKCRCMGNYHYPYKVPAFFGRYVGMHPFQ